MNEVSTWFRWITGALSSGLEGRSLGLSLAFFWQASMHAVEVGACTCVFDACRCGVHRSLYSKGSS